MTNLEALLPGVRRKLNITWSDEETEARLRDIVTTAIDTLSHKLGAPAGFDFAVDPAALGLLRDWCLYEWNHRAHQFSSDFAAEIEQMRARLILDEEDADGEGL